MIAQSNTVNCMVANVAPPTLCPRPIHPAQVLYLYGVRLSLFLPILLGPVLAVTAQDVTFHADVAPIVYQECAPCHRDGGIGPMPFTNYQEVAAYGEFIAYVTSIGYMPPWSPDPEYSHFVGERVLTQEQLDVLSLWVEQGKPEGNPADGPDLPPFSDGSQVGTPDAVRSMDVEYVHGGDMTDQYQVFVLPTEFSESVAIKALEVMPGNGNVAHHAILGLDVSGTAAQLDAAEPGPGYESFGGFGFNAESSFFGAWVPGALPVVYPPGMGRTIPANADLLLQMHYGPTPIEETDLSTVNIHFSDGPIEREVITAIMGPQHLDAPFVLPPGQVSSFHGTLPVTQDVSLISIAPHCHLIGSSWLVYATSPDDLDTIPLISIPQWDFNWQGYFTFPHLTKVPGGYTLHGEATYDNTAGNPFNPNDPPQWVTFGEGTEDEMFFIFLDVVPYQEGDENIALDPAGVPCPADVSGDGLIGVTDILLLLSDFGCLNQCDHDVDGDGVITVSDVLTILGQFGEAC